jgi:hypothetical protein
MSSSFYHPVVLPSFACSQLPPDIAQRYVLLLDPMLGMPLCFAEPHPQLRHHKQLQVDRL